MGLWQNIVNKCKVAKKRADEATTDYVANAEVGLDEGKKMLSEMESELFKLRQKAKVNEGKQEEAQSQFDRIEDLIARKAKKAASAKGAELTKHKTDLAQLVEEKKVAQSALDEIDTLVQSNEVNIQKIMQKRDELRGKLRTAESKLATQKAELATANITEKLNQGVKTFESDNPLAGIDALDSHVKDRKAAAEVAEEMSGEQTGKTLDRIEAELQDGGSVDDEVAALIAGAKTSKKK